MRWDTGALRVVFLVASAVSAGYLWRAALEGDSELGRLLDTSSPGIVAPTPAPSDPAWNAGGVPDRELGAERRRSAPVEPARPAPKATKGKRPAAKPKRPAQRPPRPAAKPEAVATPVARPQPPALEPEPAAPKPPPKPTPKPPTPQPKPPTPPTPKPPTPQPKPPTGGSGPTGGTPAPAPPAPAPPVPAPPTPSSAPAGSGQLAPPPPPPPPTPPPDAEPAAVAQRPGWGHGDKNHDHTGPPAKKQK